MCMCNLVKLFYGDDFNGAVAMVVLMMYVCW